MRKVWICKRPKVGRKGFYVYVKWIDGQGRERAKSMRDVREARQYQSKKYQELNSDVYSEAISVSFDFARCEFIKSKESGGLASGTIVQLKLALKHFEDAMYLPPVDKIKIEHIEEYIRTRLAKEPKPSNWTVSSELSALRTFFNWCKEKKYSPGLKIKRLRCPRIVFHLPHTESIRKLFLHCPCLAWRVRLLISLVTGLRAGDVDSLPLDSIDLKRKSITATSKKTGKTFIDRPLPDAAIPTIKRYVKGLPAEQVGLFTDINRRKTFEAIKIKAGLPTLTRQHLRKTFSTLMQMTGNLKTAQQLLEHSDSRTTTDFYTGDIVLRWKINQLNPQIKKWLKIT